MNMNELKPLPANSGLYSTNWSLLYIGLKGLLKYMKKYYPDTYKSYFYDYRGWVYVKLNENNYIRAISLVEMLRYYKKLKISIDSNIEKWYTLYMISKETE